MSPTPDPQVNNVTPFPRRGAAKTQPTVVPRPQVSPKPAAQPASSKDAFKYLCPKEARYRKLAVTVSAALVLVFGACGVYCIVAEHALVILPFGSGVLVEAILEVFPQAWILAALHNFLIASLALGFMVAAGPAHVDPPGDPRSPRVVLWRREERFTLPEAMLATSVLLAGVATHLWIHRIPGAIVEGIAFGLFVHIAARQFIPMARPYLVLEIDENDGMRNRIATGHGLHSWKRGSLVIPHGRFLVARKSSPIWEALFGLATLRVAYVDAAGHRREVRLRALGSAALVQRAEHFLNGDFAVAKSKDSPYAWMRAGAPASRTHPPG